MTAYYVWRTLQGGAAIRISSVAGLVRAPKSLRYYLRHLPFVLRAAAFALLVVALARPQRIEQNVHTSSEGIDIVMAIARHEGLWAHARSVEMRKEILERGGRFATGAGEILDVAGEAVSEGVDADE